MTDVDSQSGPNVTLDAHGDAIVSYTSIQQLNDTTMLVTPTSGSAFLVPVSQFVGTFPGVQTTAGTCTISDAYAKSMSII